MEMTGKVIAILPQRAGTSARGEWASQQFVIETQEQYPKHLCFEVFGADRITQFNIQGGETITVSFDINARQYQDKWYNSIQAWNVVRQQPGGQQMPPQGGYQQPPQQAWGQNNPQAGYQSAQQASQNVQGQFPPQQPAPQGKQGGDGLPF